MPPPDPAAPSPPAVPPVSSPAHQPTHQPEMRLNPVYTHTGLATASLILGIVSLPASILSVLTLPIPFTAILLGVIGLKHKKNFAISGIILGIIGLILSAVVLAVGTHIENSKKTGGGSSNSQSASGNQVNSSCYKFNLPDGLSAKDIQSNSECKTIALNSSSTEDFEVQSSAVSATLTDANQDEVLKHIIEQVELAAGDKIKVTQTKFTTIDGQRAYEATGTENYLNYKFVSFLAVIAPQDYISKTGEKIRGFVLASDSATSQNGVDLVAQTWHWQ
ncbi:MAG: hypothetical protein ACXWLH_03160 [Candidatus Saccharimonadales bacterium]